MKKASIFILVVTTSLFYSCQFNQSIEKDLKTGAQFRGNGLGSDDIYMEINGETVTRNAFIFGENVTFIFNNVKGLKSVDDKTFPAMSMHIIKNEKDTVFSNPILLADLVNGTTVTPLQLQANFVAALPYKNKEKYKVFIAISDQKGDGTFTYEMPFTVVENDLLDVESDGIKYSNIYLWNETQKKTIFTNQVSSEDEFILIMEGIEGITQENAKVFPVFAIDLVDSKGKVLLSNPNMLGDNNGQGYSPEDLKKQLIAKISFTKGMFSNPCHLTAKLTDTNLSNQIVVKTDLIIK